MKLKVKKTVLKRKVNNVTTTGYYGRVVSNGKIAFDEVARNSTRNTTLHPSEAELAAKMLLEGICEQLKQGMIVDMGPLGTLYPAVSGAWKTDPEELSLGELTPKVNYKASDDIAGAIKAATLAWTTEAETSDTTTPTGEDVTDDNTSQGGSLGGD